MYILWCIQVCFVETWPPPIMDNIGKTKRSRQGDAHQGLCARGQGGGGAGGVQTDEARGPPAGAVVCLFSVGFLKCVSIYAPAIICILVDYWRLRPFLQNTHNTQSQDLAVCTAVLEALGRPSDTAAGAEKEKKKSGKDRMLDFWMEMRLNGVEPDAVVRVVWPCLALPCLVVCVYLYIYMCVCGYVDTQPSLSSLHGG